MSVTTQPSKSTSLANHQLESIGQELAQIAQSMGHEDMARDLGLELSRRLDAATFRVMVLGEVKHGKSSLLNTLLRKPLLPVGVVPTTSALVGIRIGEHQAHHAVLPDGSEIPIDESDFVALATGKNKVHHPKLQTLRPTLVRVTTPHATFSPGLEFYDTPGFNDVDRLREQVARAAIPSTDLLLIVLDATQALSLSEMALLERSFEAVGGVDRPGQQLLIAINRCDLVPEEAHQDIQRRVRDLLRDFNAHDAKIWMTQSRFANDAQAEALDKLQPLRDHILSLSAQRGTILPDRAKKSLAVSCRRLEQSAGFQLQALRNDEVQLRENLEAIHSRIQTQTEDFADLRRHLENAQNEAEKQLDAAVSSFREKVQKDFDEIIQSADLDQLTQLLPGALREWMLEFGTQQSQALQSSLEKATVELLAVHGALLERRLGVLRRRHRFRQPLLFVAPQSMGIEIASIVLGLVGTAVMYFGRTRPGMIMTIAAPIANVVLREKAVRQAREDLRRSLPAHLDRTLSILSSGLKREAKRYTEELEHFVSVEDRRLSETLRLALQRALELHEGEDTRATREQIATLEQQLNRLETLRARLSGPPAGNH